MTPGEMFSVWGLFSVFFFHFSFGIKESLQWVLEIRVPAVLEVTTVNQNIHIRRIQ